IPLHGLEEHEYEWFATHGTERFAESGETIFREGEPANHMSIMLKGEIHVRREHGGPGAIWIGRSGIISGLLPFSRMKTYGGHGYAVTPPRPLPYHPRLFPAMVRARPSNAHTSLSLR